MQRLGWFALSTVFLCSCHSTSLTDAAGQVSLIVEEATYSPTATVEWVSADLRLVIRNESPLAMNQPYPCNYSVESDSGPSGAFIDVYAPECPGSSGAGGPIPAHSDLPVVVTFILSKSLAAENRNYRVRFPIAFEGTFSARGTSAPFAITPK